MYSIDISNINGNKNTWTDWFLLPESRPVVNLPQTVTHYVEIPGRNGSLDLTEFLSGKPTYQNRTGSWDFIVLNSNLSVSGLNDNSKWIDFDIPKKRWSEIYSEIAEFLHGQLCIIEMHDEIEIPSPAPAPLYFKGRLDVNSWKSDEKYSTISINYNLLPFRFENGHSEAATSRDAGGVF